MVAKGIYLPNIRRFFVPDPGYTIGDSDLSGADAQVVAWEAGDEDLKSAFRSGVKIHVHNARTMWPHEHKDMSDDEIKDHSKFYKPAKIGCHAANYGASVNALVTNIGWSERFAHEFLDRWFSAHPPIKEWHNRTERCLTGEQCYNCWQLGTTPNRPCPKCGVVTGRTIKNRFGFRRVFLDRISNKLKGEALAWAPQSTVAFCTEIGWTAIEHGPEITMLLGHGEPHHFSWRNWLVQPDSYELYHDIVIFLIQVHDSIVFQVPHKYEDIAGDIAKAMHVVVPYDDPLIIPMGIATSRLSWGDCG